MYGGVAEGDAPEVCGQVGRVEAGADLRLVGLVQVAGQLLQVVHGLRQRQPSLQGIFWLSQKLIWTQFERFVSLDIFIKFLHYPATK